jgi:hypothetical protein
MIPYPVKIKRDNELEVNQEKLSLKFDCDK